MDRRWRSVLTKYVAHTEAELIQEGRVPAHFIVYAGNGDTYGMVIPFESSVDKRNGGMFMGLVCAALDATALLYADEAWMVSDAAPGVSPAASERREEMVGVWLAYYNAGDQREVTAVVAPLLRDATTARPSGLGEPREADDWSGPLVEIMPEERPGRDQREIAAGVIRDRIGYKMKPTGRWRD